MTYRQLSNVIAGYHKKEDMLSKERWLIARKVMYSTMSPYLKENAKETDILTFPWEEEMLQKQALEEEAQLEEIVKINTSFWENFDSNKKVIN